MFERLITALRIKRAAAAAAVSSSQLQALLEKIQRQLSAKRFQLVSLGGVNNIAMVLFFDGNDIAYAIAKIELTALAQREWQFIRWQQQFNPGLTPDPFALHELAGSDYQLLVSQYCRPFDGTNPDAVNQLFLRLAELPQLPILFEGVPKLVADTPIKTALSTWVQKTPWPQRQVHLSHLLQQRQEVLGRSQADLAIALTALAERCQSWLDQQCQGLVHGDFKYQNMLWREDLLCLIDLQYYCIGNRLWDLAFYYSKHAIVLSDLLQTVSKQCDLDEQMQQSFVLYFAIACLLSGKKKVAQRAEGKLAEVMAVIAQWNDSSVV